MNTNERASNEAASNRTSVGDDARVLGNDRSEKMAGDWFRSWPASWSRRCLCVVLPKSYRSSTLILIENQKIPDDYVKGIGGGEHRGTTDDDPTAGDEPNVAESDHRRV